jgi:hypothetical protein
VSRTAAIVAAAMLAGLVARAWLIEIAPRYGFLGDHVDYVCWGREAVDAGVLALYRQPPGACPAIAYIDGERRSIITGTGERLNYPPLAAYVFWIQGRLLAALDPTRIANTVTARAVFALGTSIAELVTAVGVAALVQSFAGGTVALIAFAATWLAPPLLADGPFWGQTESWILAPIVWMVWAMGRERWLLAGALWGAALALKPSAVLVGPLWAYALAFRPPRLRIVAGGVVAGIVVNALALPFWLTSGVAWLRTTYLANYVYGLHWTTMLTFNVWYAELLLNGTLDSQTPLFGVARDTWGTALLVMGLLVAFALTRRWERRNPARRHLAFVPLAALVTLAAVTFPTRVHGTYTAFTAPFLIALACLVPGSIPSAAVMLIAATLQILSWQWGNLLAVHALPNEQTLPPARQAARRALRDRDLPREWALTIVSLGATAGVFAAVAGARRRDDETDAHRPSRETGRA